MYYFFGRSTNDTLFSTIYDFHLNQQPPFTLTTYNGVDGIMISYPSGMTFVENVTCLGCGDMILD